MSTKERIAFSSGTLNGDSNKLYNGSNNRIFSLVVVLSSLKKHLRLTDDIWGLRVVGELVLIFIFSVLVERALVTGF